MNGPRLIGLTAGLGAVMAAGTLLGFAFGVLAPFLVDDLGLSALAVGLLPSVMYATGALVAGSTGRVIDRLGVTVALRTVPVLVAVAALLPAAVPHYGVVVTAAVLAGVPLAATNPTTNRVVSAALPSGRRGGVMGGKQAGVAGGAVLTGVALPLVADAAGWRVALAATALACLLLAAALRVPVPASGDTASAATTTVWVPVRLLDLDLFAVAMGAANGAVAAYLVLFAVADLGLAPQRAGLAAAVMGAVSVVARVGWAWASDRRGRPVAGLAALGLVAVVGGSVAVIAAGTDTRPLLWAAAVLFGASATSWQGLLMLAAVDRVPTARAGAVSGRMTRSFYAGYVGGPVAFGLLVDHTAGGYVTGWLAVTVASGVAALALLTGLRRSHGDGRPVGPRVDGSD